MLRFRGGERFGKNMYFIWVGLTIFMGRITHLSFVIYSVFRLGVQKRNY